MRGEDFCFRAGSESRVVGYLRQRQRHAPLPGLQKRDGDDQINSQEE